MVAASGPPIAALITLVVGVRLRAESDHRREAAVLTIAPLAILALTFGGLGSLEFVPREALIGIAVWGLSLLFPLLLVLVLLVEITAVSLALQRVDRARTGLIAVLWPVVLLAIGATALV